MEELLLPVDAASCEFALVVVGGAEQVGTLSGGDDVADAIITVPTLRGKASSQQFSPLLVRQHHDPRETSGQGITPMPSSLAIYLEVGISDPASHLVGSYAHRARSRQLTGDWHRRLTKARANTWTT